VEHWVFYPYPKKEAYLMNDRDALFAAILAHPDEDTPRLALADWLEDNGNAKYAKFIRKQIELANVEEWEAPWIHAWNNDRDALTGYRLKTFEPRLPKDLEWPSLTAYRRGFPWQVESKGVAPFLKHADKLTAQIPLQALTVHGTEDWQNPIDLSALLVSPHMARLKHLGFSLVNLTADAIKQMQACPHRCGLNSLTFAFTEFGRGAIQAFCNSPLIEQLETLHIEDSWLDWRPFAQNLVRTGGPHKLKRFVVSHYPSGDSVWPRVFDAPVLRGLKEFEISGCEMGERNVRAFCASQIVHGLESLTLNKINPGVPGIETLTNCAAFRSLKRLRLRWNRIGAVAVKHLARSPHLAGLQVLDLETNAMGDKGAIALAEAPFIANLIELSLMHCNIGDAGAEALMNALSADKMITLNLHSDAKISTGTRRKLRKKFGDRVFV